MGNSAACPGKPHDVCSDSKLHTQNLHQLPHAACIPGPGSGGGKWRPDQFSVPPASVIHWSPRRLTAEGAVCQHCNTAASSPSRVTSWHRTSLLGIILVSCRTTTSRWVCWMSSRSSMEYRLISRTRRSRKNWRNCGNTCGGKSRRNLRYARLKY